AIVALAEKYVNPPTEGGGVAPKTALTEAPCLQFLAKETEQYHICFGAPGIDREDERRFPLAVLDSIFGGSTSSRLFREGREKRGLAYSVGSYNEQFTDTGLVAPGRKTSRGRARSSAPSSPGCAPSRSRRRSSTAPRRASRGGSSSPPS